MTETTTRTPRPRWCRLHNTASAMSTSQHVTVTHPTCHPSVQHHTRTHTHKHVWHTTSLCQCRNKWSRGRQSAHEDGVIAQSGQMTCTDACIFKNKNKNMTYLFAFAWCSYDCLVCFWVFCPKHKWICVHERSISVAFERLERMNFIIWEATNGETQKLCVVVGHVVGVGHVLFCFLICVSQVSFVLFFCSVDLSVSVRAYFAHMACNLLFLIVMNIELWS